MKGVLEGIVPVLAECVKNGERKVLVTIAAGLPMSFYREVLGEISIPLIRLMPNTPAAVGQGMTLLTSDGASEDDIAKYDQAFGIAVVLLIIVLGINLLTRFLTNRFDVTKLK